MVEGTKDVSSVGIILIGFGAGGACLGIDLLHALDGLLHAHGRGAGFILWTLTKDMLFTEKPESLFDKSLAQLQTDQRVRRPPRRPCRDCRQVLDLVGDGIKGIKDASAKAPMKCAARSL